MFILFKRCKLDSTYRVTMSDSNSSYSDKKVRKKDSDKSHKKSDKKSGKKDSGKKSDKSYKSDKKSVKKSSFVLKKLESNKKPKKFDIKFLQNINDKTEEIRGSTFNELLTECHNKIKVFGENGRLFCFYTVPEFRFGKPMFNLQNCVSWIIKSLRDDDFKVIQITKNILYISWST